MYVAPISGIDPRHDGSSVQGMSLIESWPKPHSRPQVRNNTHFVLVVGYDTVNQTTLYVNGALRLVEP